MKIQHIAVYAGNTSADGDHTQMTIEIMDQVLRRISNAEQNPIFIVMFVSNSCVSNSNQTKIKHFMYEYFAAELQKKNYEISLETKSAEFVKTSFWDGKRSVALLYPINTLGISESDAFQVILKKRHANSLAIASVFDEMKSLKKEWQKVRGFVVEDGIAYWQQKKKYRPRKY